MKDIKANIDMTLRQAMKKLSKAGEKCLVVTDEKDFLLGTLSDGDVRKGIIKGANINEPISTIYQKNPTILKEGEYTLSEAKELFIQKKFDLIPITDDKKVLKDIIFIEQVIKDVYSIKKEIGDIPVVIMAGGEGTRLKPFTDILPKPLVPIHEKPIIEHIIESFNPLCNEFIVTVNYKAKLLKAYFDELNPRYRVKFINETKPLGTAGSLHLLKNKIKNPFFVTNCDIIIKSDYSSVYDFHLKGGYDITLVASAKEYVIPYGTCQLDKNGYLSHINEKPSYDFLVNTGFYVLNPEIIDFIPKNEFFHITDLFDGLKKRKKKVGVFPIDEDSWIDIGQWAEYRKAVDLL